VRSARLRFWEHLIHDDEDFRRHVAYCYINPVKHGLAARVRDWPHSSFHRDVRAELFPEDWPGDVSAEVGFGERVRVEAAQCAALIAPYGSTALADDFTAENNHCA
jgi:hypothetical protein